MATVAVIDRFTGKYECFSNFFEREFTYRGMKCKTLEHPYQALKSSDPKEFAQIMLAETPGKAKRMGGPRGIIKSFRPDWEDIKYDLMVELVRAKFSQHADLREILLGTGDAILIEGNYHHDNIWGDCYCGRLPKCDKAGRNLLGKALMQVREELRNAQNIGPAT
jgi:ribA/ribD-fused uncharacterized protein